MSDNNEKDLSSGSEDITIENGLRDFEAKLQNLDNQLAAQKKKRLIRWTIRQVILIIIVVIFWDKPWIKWVLIVAIPFSLLGLGVIFYYDKKVKEKFGQTMEKIEALAETEEEEN